MLPAGLAIVDDPEEDSITGLPPCLEITQKTQRLLLNQR